MPLLNRSPRCTCLLLKEDFALLLSVDIDYQCHNKALAEPYGTVRDGKHVQLTSFLS